MIKLITEYFKDTNSIKCYNANGEFQGKITINSNSEITLGITDYVGKSTGRLTLRSAIPESELSEYNIAKCLLDSVRDRRLVKDEYLSKLVPEEFGYKSYRTMIVEDNYKDMTRDQLIDELVDMKLQIESLEKAGLI